LKKINLYIHKLLQLFLSHEDFDSLSIEIEEFQQKHAIHIIFRLERNIRTLRNQLHHMVNFLTNIEITFEITKN